MSISWLVREAKGDDTIRLLPELLQSLIVGLSFPKSMRWGNNQLTFARPIQWLVALFGQEVLPISHEGIASGNLTRGHRFLANEQFALQSAASYIDQLAEKYVLVDPAQRRAEVIAEIKQAVADSQDLPGRQGGN